MYSTAQVWLDNIPYIATVILGASIVGYAWNITTAIIFAVYGAVGALWFIVFICPYCELYGTRTCPCGYGTISAMFMKKKKGENFKKIFMRNVPVIFPIWIAPVIAGVYSVLKTFSLAMPFMLAGFVIVSCIVLPLASKNHGCLHCPNRKQCPWVGKEATDTDETVY